MTTPYGEAYITFMENKKATKEQKPDEPVKFKGKFISAIGRRKSAVARIRLYKNGKGFVMVNETKLNRYFTPHQVTVVNQPAKQAGQLRNFNFSVLVKGGGKKAQAQAIRHGMARVLVEYDKDLKPVFKAKGWLTRDARKKERKKPGLKKARRAPQWSKR